ncbi:heterokaryon incompatibility domain-containing protein [Trichoderma austrokoningii]
MPWGQIIWTWGRHENFETLPESGCCVCFALENILRGGQGTFGLQEKEEGYTYEPHESMLKWILVSYSKWINEYPTSRRPSREDENRVTLEAAQNGLAALDVLDYKGRPTKTYEIVFQKLHSSTDIPFEDVKMDTSWIDLRVATMWKEKCINQHGSKCQELDKTALIIPDWLIDTEENCIVSGEGVAEFVALSYRWGTSIGSAIDFNKLSDLRKPGGQSNFIAKIPIIRDAAQVVRSVNERYLWVDTICIRHDEKDHLAHQLQCMGAIYASSKLTIIASDGDGMAGIPGLKGCSIPRNLINMFSWTNNRVILVRDLPMLDGSEVQSKCFRRGWTFQEYALSRRRLVFGRQQIHWICGCETWHEDLPSKDVQIHKPNNEITQFSNTLRRWPDFRKLSGLLRAYNNLELTCPEDALPGVAGLLRLLNSSFHGGFLFGLPMMCFEAALLWQHGYGHNIVSRKEKTTVGRRKRSIRARSILPDSKLPSWSWVGWSNGCLNLLKDEEDYRVVTYPNHSLNGSVSRSEKWVTKPTVQWYYHDTPACIKKQPVYSSWFQAHQDMTHAEDLPEGWIREKYPGVNGPDIADMRSLPYGITGEFIYHHREYPDLLYWRPFPVPRASNIHTSHQIKQGKFISCKTKRGWFRYVRNSNYALGHGSLDYHLEILDARN